MKKKVIFIALIFGLELYLEILSSQDFYNIPLFFQKNYMSVAYVIWVLRIVCLSFLSLVVFRKLKAKKEA
ncbi:hypothetical protein EOL94_01780 [bacterium]|nr:hypothetical protein [bacterium]